MTAECFRYCYAQLPEATLLVSIEGRILEANPAARKLLRKPDDLAGSSLAELVVDPPEKVTRLLTLFRRNRTLLPGALLFKNESSMGLPCRVEGGLFSPTPEGGLLVLRLFLKEEATRRFNQLNERIDDLGREVATRKRAEAQLYAQRELLRATLSSIGDGVIVTDGSGGVTFLNPVAEQLTGWSQAEAQGAAIEDVFVITNEQTGAPVDNPVRRVLEKGQVAGLANHTILTAKDGRQFPIDDSGAPIRNADGQVSGVVLVFRDVSERKRAEKERQRLIFAVEGSPNFVGLIDIAGAPIYINRAGQQLIGAKNLEECRSIALAEYFPPQEQDFVREVVIPTALQEGLWKGELHLRHFRTGEEIPVLYDTFRIDDPHTGKPSSLATVTRDIRELAASREALRRSLEFDEAVMKNMGEGLYTVDVQGLVTSMNPAAEKLFGWKFEELRGRKMHDVTHHHYPDGRPFPAEECSGYQVLKQGRSLVGHEDVFIRKDGSFFDVIYSSSPLTAGGEISGLVVVFQDVSERKALERALRESEQSYRAIGESIDYGVWICAPDGRNIYASDSFLRLLGVTQDECSEFGWAEALHPDDSANTIAKWKECVRTGGQWSIEHRFRGVDGRYHWILARGLPVRDERGEIVSWAGINLDIGYLKAGEENLRARERELRATNIALLRANEDLNQFAFAASHDLQEPLRVVSSYSQLLVKGYSGQIEGEAALCLKFIMDGVKRMRELLADLLAYTQLNSDVTPDEGDSVDLNQAFAKAVENCKGSVEESGAIVTSDRLPFVVGYEPHFLQLLQNLIGNAIKYRAERRPRIHVSATESNGVWILAVADNGMGIAPEYLQKIFGVFKRLHSKEIPGTGIGLAICQRVVDRYGGRIWVESEVGQGSTFFCTLPTAKGISE